MSQKQKNLNAFCEYVTEQLAKRGHKVDRVKILKTQIVFAAAGRVVHVAARAR